jgi:DNA polymerase V
MQDDLQALANSDGVSIHSGFPNPGLARRGQGAQLALDLNQLLVKHPSSTYLFRVSGHTWADQGIYDGDVVIVERARSAQTTDLVVTWHDGSLAIDKRHRLPATTQVWGVVVTVIHQYHP